MKAYATRVGNGPFPTEIFSQVGEDIVERGVEYGTTTNRKRRLLYLLSFNIIISNKIHYLLLFIIIISNKIHYLL